MGSFDSSFLVFIFIHMDYKKLLSNIKIENMLEEEEKDLNSRVLLIDGLNLFFRNFSGNLFRILMESINISIKHSEINRILLNFKRFSLFTR